MELIEPGHCPIPIIRQCQILGVNRSSYYYEKKPETKENLHYMNLIDKIYTRHPYYGAPKITEQLKRDGYQVNHKRIERLMGVMGISAIYPKKNLSKNNHEHEVYPYLLKDLIINRVNQVWGTDITYIRALKDWFYLTAIMDWRSRYVLSWRLSKNMNVDFCAEALAQALSLATPEIHNSDQGSQFTAKEYLDILKAREEILISMDGRGRCFDNIFTERLWRSVKYEEVYLKEYSNFDEAESSLKEYFNKYNNERLHQSLGYKTPAEVYFG